MPKRACLICGRLSEASRCPAHAGPWAQRSPSSRATARPGWNRLRALALMRDGSRCVRCGATEGLAAHHVVPVAEGGTMALDNLTTLCERCHRGAHHRPAA